jgi:hypothetical protein
MICEAVGVCLQAGGVMLKRQISSLTDDTGGSSRSPELYAIGPDRFEDDLVEQ